MTSQLEQSLLEQKQLTQQDVPQIPGILGIPLDGQRQVEVRDRNAYVYVRLRNSQNEVIQAFNNQVAPAYNLPVLVERQGNRYVVIGVDTQRYENNWNSFAPFLPRHGNTHSFDIESGGGGDIVWVYPRQFMPSLVMPSGSLGAGDVFVNAYTLKKNDNSWIYVGNTGTPSLLPYRPSSPTGAIMALIYLDVTTGNPGFFINSGTVFLNSITGSSQLAPYIPSITDPTTQIPLAAIRLITGTNAISWDNIYDVRQWIHPSPTGTGGGSSLTIQDEGVSQGTATTLNFVGDNVQATVSGGVARIFVTGSSGGGGINTGTLDARYLKLDASNDPLTGELEIQPAVGSPGTYALRVTAIDRPGFYIESKSSFVGNFVARQDVLGIEFDHEASGTNVNFPMFLFARYPTWSGSTFFRPVLDIDDTFDYGAKYYGGTVRHKHSGTVIFEANPHATGSTIPYIYDTSWPKPTGTILASWRSQGAEKAYLDVSGTFYSNGSPLIKEAPVNGQSFLRKNAGWKQNVNYLPFGVYINTSPMTTTPAFPYGVTLDRNMELKSFAVSFFVGTPNDASNFWTILLKTHPAGRVVNRINTTGTPANTWTNIIDTSFSVSSVAASDQMLLIECTKTGSAASPGQLFFPGVLLESDY